MHRHASVNRIYRLVWSHASDSWVPAAETTRGRGKGSCKTLLAAALSLSAGLTEAAPLGGQVVSGSGQIGKSGALTTITQTSPLLSLSWASFNIAAQETVDFVQPSASAIAVNRITGTNGTQILGHLNSNGQVYLINPNGIVFGRGAQVDVGGLVASTLDLSDASLAGGEARTFSGTGTGSIFNAGTINATGNGAGGGFVALIGNHVTNQGMISARLGTVALGAGSAATLTFQGDSLVHLQVDRSVLNSMAANGGLIRADGGQVLMSAGAKDALLASVVNNTGVIEARTVEEHDGTITLLGGMAAGTANVAGTLDASAPNGGNGGFIETSAAHVEVANSAKITTASAHGLTGSWLIDPQDFTVASTGGDITGAALSTQLASTNENLQSSAGAATGSGNVNINDPVSWSANTTLTLTASNNVNINASLTASGNTAGVVIRANTVNGNETASGPGIYTLNNGASINLPGTNPNLSISGTSFIVINTLGAQGDAATAPGVPTLQGMAAPANLGTSFALGANIDAAATSSWNGGAGFTPIGTGANQFTGIFDGLGHTISHLYINLPSSSQSAGLFGRASNLIQNIGLIDGSVTGGNDVGMLAGDKGGDITNSYATGTVMGTQSGGQTGGLVGYQEGSNITDSYAAVTVTGTRIGGGLVGAGFFATITNSYATGAVSAAGYAGGLVGYHIHGTITDSYATGAANGTTNVGGLVGSAFGDTITRSYSTGHVSGTSYFGGLAGYSTGATITNSYWNTTTSGQNSSAAGTGLSSTQMQTGSNFAGFNFSSTPGAGGNSWVMVDVDGGFNNAGGYVGGQHYDSVPGATYPMLTSEYSTSIANAHQLQLMALAPAAAYTLASNIDASATAHGGASGGDVWSTAGGFFPIGTGQMGGFTGSFDGLGHTISTLTMAWTAELAYVGLFGNAQPGSNIKNVGLIDASVTSIGASDFSQPANGTGALVGTNQGSVSNSYATGTVSGGSYVGGLVGNNYGALSTASINNSHATVAVSGMSRVGGLVGGNYGSGGSITNSYATGTVVGTSTAGGLVGWNNGSMANSYATGNVSDGMGGGTVGGLVGGNYGSIANTYATGPVTGSIDVGGLVGTNFGSISTSYSTGQVSGSGNVGGLVGQNPAGAITDGYWNMTTSGQATSAQSGGTHSAVGGLTPLQMQTASNFAGFTFSTTPGAPGNSWVMVDVDGTLNNAGGLGATFPMLTSEYSTTIANTHQLQLMNLALGASYTLAANIDASATGSGGDVWSTSGGFNPVGNSWASPFAGSLDGLGHTISNLTIDWPAMDFVGLFGVAGGSAIRNVGLIGADVTGSDNVGGLAGGNSGSIDNSYITGNVRGVTYLGGLAGFSAGTISNSYATVSVSGTSDLGGLVGLNESVISNSHATGNVSGSSYVGGLVGSNGIFGVGGTIDTSYSTGIVIGTSRKIGGLAGQNYGTINNSYATGSVTGSSYVGGLVGLNPGAISNSDATGSVSGGNGVGGLVGQNYGAVNDSYATGSVSGTSGVGGLAGQNFGTINTTYAVGSVSGSVSVGGLVGQNVGGTITDGYWNTTTSGQAKSAQTDGGYLAAGGLSTLQMQTASNFAGFTFSTTAGAPGNSWAMLDVDGSFNNAGGLGATFPMLTSEYSTTIANTHQLELMNLALGASYTLAANIDGSATGRGGGSGGDVWSTTGGFFPIGSGAIGTFAGSFDGFGHTISNLTMDWPGISNVALFGYVQQDSIIRNVGLAGASVTGSSYVGGLVGHNYGAISNSYVSGIVSGVADVGGLIGYNYGTVNNSYATGNVSGARNIGGLVGYGAYPTTVNNTYASGSVTGTDLSSTGGLVGSGNSATNSFTYEVVNGVAATGIGSAGETGLSSAGLMTMSNFSAAGWSISSTGGANVWRIYEGNSAPLLTGLLTPLTVAASNVATVFNGVGFSGNGVTYSVTPNGNLLGSLSYGAAQGAVGAGSYAITPTGLYSNQQGYSITAVSATLTISPLALTGTISTGVSVYGSLLTPGTLVFANLIPGYTAVSGGAATVSIGGNLSTSNHLKAGSYPGAESVSGALTGADAGDYTFAGANGDYTVLKVALSGSIAAGSSVYGAALAPGAVSLSNVIGADAVAAGTVTVTTAGNLSSSEHLKAGSYTGSESVSGALTGADAGDYTFTGANGDYTVTPLALTVAATGANKVYNGTTSDAPTLSGDVILGDHVSFADSAANFAVKNVGSGLAVAVSGITLSGADAADYALNNTSAMATASISQASLTVSGIAAENKVYDGNAVAVLAGGTLVGVVAGDTGLVALTDAGSFASQNVGTGLSVAAAETLSGVGAGNYVLVQPTGLSANITPATLIYEATPAGRTAGQSLTGFSGALSGFVAGETQVNATTGTLAWTTPANAGSRAGQYAINGSGLTASNYVFIEAPGNAAALTLAPAPPSGVQALPPGAQSAIAGLQAAMLDEYPVAGTARTIGTTSASLRVVNGGVRLPQ